jgi:hypothetical protein
LNDRPDTFHVDDVYFGHLSRFTLDKIEPFAPGNKR